MPLTTQTNQSSTRNENGWFHIATQWEKLLTLQKKVSDSGVSKAKRQPQATNNSQ